MNIVLISTYEMGRQPFGLASPAAWLRQRGHQVTCLDLSRDSLNEQAVREAALIAFYAPMHTATRLILQLLEPLRRMNPRAHLCAYGLYAALAAESFASLGVKSLFGGEFEQALANLAERLSAASTPSPLDSRDSSVSLARLHFQIPDRDGLPPLRSYAHLVLPGGEHRVAGYTEASRGCKHLCRHCPIVPVYNGVFRIVDSEVVLADIRRQVAAGAQHITFGDPDFFNGTGHSIPLVESLHREFPQLTYDVTIKVQHLLKHSNLLPALRATGCLFIVSAVESLDDATLQNLQKNHTRADFFRVVDECSRAGMTLQPTFVPFTPWTNFEQFLDLLEQLQRLELIEAVAPIQLGIRLLIPPASKLFELEEIRKMVGPFDAEALVYPWKNANSGVDALAEQVQEIVASGEKVKLGRTAIFQRIWRAAKIAAGSSTQEPAVPLLPSRATVPYLNEPWYC